MRFKKGATVVHPRHGTVKVAGVESRDLGSGPADYLVLEAITGSLKLMIRVDQAEEGLRAVASKDEARRALATIASAPDEKAGTWVTRARTSDAKVAAGTLVELAEVVRDLSIAHAGDGIGTSELRSLTIARSAVVSEIAAALGITRESAAAKVDAALASRA